MKSSKNSRGHRVSHGRGKMSHRSEAYLAKHLRDELDKYFRTRHESHKK